MTEPAPPARPADGSPSVPRQPARISGRVRQSRALPRPGRRGVRRGRCDGYRGGRPRRRRRCASDRRRQPRRHLDPPCLRCLGTPAAGAQTRVPQRDPPCPRTRLLGRSHRGGSSGGTGVGRRSGVDRLGGVRLRDRARGSRRQCRRLPARRADHRVDRPGRSVRRPARRRRASRTGGVLRRPTDVDPDLAWTPSRDRRARARECQLGPYGLAGRGVDRSARTCCCRRRTTCIHQEARRPAMPELDGSGRRAARTRESLL